MAPPLNAVDRYQTKAMLLKIVDPRHYLWQTAKIGKQQWLWRACRVLTSDTELVVY